MIFYKKFKAEDRNNFDAAIQCFDQQISLKHYDDSYFLSFLYKAIIYELLNEKDKNNDSPSHYTDLNILNLYSQCIPLLLTEHKIIWSNGYKKYIKKLIGEKQDKKIFLSYAHESKQIVRTFYDLLTTELGVDCWIDHKEVKPSGDFNEEQKKGIEKSIMMCCFLTRDFLKSPACFEEVEYFKDVKDKESNVKKFYPILLEEIHDKEKQPEISFPEYLGSSVLRKIFSGKKYSRFSKFPKFLSNQNNDDPEKLKTALILHEELPSMLDAICDQL